MSEELPTVVQALAGVMDSIGPVGKNDVNSHFGFNFRGIDAVLDAVAPALRSHGVVVIPELREQTSEIVGKSFRVTVKVAYNFYGPRGDHITALVPGEAMDSQDKAGSKAMSVAFRTALIQALAIPTGERDPHAGPPVGRKLADLRKQVQAAGAAKKMTFDEVRDDYALWSKGAEIQAATEKDLTDYLRHLGPSADTTTMQRTRRGPG